MVGVAQLARAPGCGPGGRGFKPRRPPQKCGGAYSETSAPHTRWEPRAACELGSGVAIFIMMPL